MKRLAAIVAACLLCVAAVQAETAELVVVGEGRASAAPDMALVTLSVTEEARSAQAAMRAASTGMQAILDALDGFGVAAPDRQTSRLTLNPVWASRSSGSDAPRITGYRADTGITVRMRDLDRLGALLDTVLEDGANGFGGLQFTFADPQPLHDAARKAAVEDAMRTAQLLAEAAGQTLGPLQSLRLGFDGRPGPAMARMEMAADTGVPLAAGEVSITAQVTAVYAVLPMAAEQ